MATYGQSFYGQDTYGTDIRPDFDVSPVTATPADYSTVLLSWTAPAGTWDTMRLLRNRYGWAVNENDGEILLDVNHLTTTFVDQGTVGGQWLYYTIFISVSGQWSRAGTVSALMPKDCGYTQALYDLVPDFYKVDVTPGNAVTDDSNTANPYLLPFLSVFGFGLDIVKTYYDSTRYTNDAWRTRFDNIQQMAAQFGIQYEASAPAYLFRQRVRDAATLGRQKGTLEQLRSLIAETTGWDTDLRIGPNLMLSDDQASFNHPIYPIWDAGVNYASGERVQFGSYLYAAGSSGAYGQAQVPTGTGSSNAYWTVVSASTDATLVNSNGNIAGWEEVSFTAGVAPGTNAVQVFVGVQDATNPTSQAGNALVVRNNNSGSSIATMGVRSVAKLAGQSTMDPQQPVLWGIPIPYATAAWDPGVFYQPGDLVTFHGRSYQALAVSQNTSPPSNATANAYWIPLGYDERTRLCLSGYTQTASSQQVAVYPFVEFYDSHGGLITALYSDALPAFNYLDSFTQNWAAWSGRTTDVGGATWSIGSGAWTSGGYDGGVSYPSGSGRATAYFTGNANGTVAVTLATSPSGAQQQGLVFRMSDTSNYWFAGRSSLQRYSAGVPTSTAYSQTFQDGDRMTVSYNGSSISVLRNGTQVLSITDSTLSSATGVGMEVR
jgi:hypothetical protein